MTDATGRRSHVEGEIEPAEAEVVRLIFRLSAEGHGTKAIAKRLNDRGLSSPRAQRGRSQTWSPSSVWDVLHRPIYRGEVVYGRTQKRDKWGRKHQTPRPESEWIRRDVPALQIVPPELWVAAHRRLEAARARYTKATKGQAFGRPPLGDPSKYWDSSMAARKRRIGSPRSRRSSGRSIASGAGSSPRLPRAACSTASSAPFRRANDGGPNSKAERTILRAQAGRPARQRAHRARRTTDVGGVLAARAGR